MQSGKIINDPVFGFINIPKGLIMEVVTHPTMQRLHRIKQLGLSSMVYPGAQHTRFQHSLGAFFLMTEAIQSLRGKGVTISDHEAESVRPSYCTMWDMVPFHTYWRAPSLQEYITRRYRCC